MTPIIVLYQSTDYDFNALLLQMNVEHWHILALLEACDKEALRTFLRDVHWNVKYAAFHNICLDSKIKNLAAANKDDLRDDIQQALDLNANYKQNRSAFPERTFVSY
jgi:hypothetical protein